MKLQFKFGNTKISTDYLEEINKQSEKYMNINQSNKAEKGDSRDILPANGQDICNYLVRYDLTNFQI